jgi:putative acetyltransferase
MGAPISFIRDEEARDTAAITEVTVEAFKTLKISRQTEHLIVDALRAANALSVSLVAEVFGSVVGHIAISPVTLSDGTAGWYGVGPISVSPAWQRKGIGTALVREGLLRLKALGAKGCCLVGHPGYYRRFDFENVSTLLLDGVPPEVFFALSFDGAIPNATVTFHPAFQQTR